MISVLLSVAIALLLDYWWGEPKRFHPLVGFGNIALWLEKRLHSKSQFAKGLGLLAWLLAVVPWLVCAYFLSVWAMHINAGWYSVVAGVVLYMALGWQSLLQHASAIATPLRQGDMLAARQALAMIVSRDTQALDETAVACAATESVLENGADAIFAALFWFLVGGMVGVVLYRLSNTLDAMWGYKNEKYRHFGWAAARVDDVLNFIPARLTALSYVAVGAWQQNGVRAWRSLRDQAGHWKSPNAGLVMAAGAGALGVVLGGAASYHGRMQARPLLGDVSQGALDQQPLPTGTTLVKACQLVNQSLVLWLCIMVVLGLVLAMSGSMGLWR